MEKPISQLTTEEVKELMSVAGNPEKIADIMIEMLMLASSADETNPAELINLELAVERVLAEVRLLKRQYEETTGQKIS